jgi:hypothetical protein
MKTLTRLLARNNITLADMVTFLKEENFLTEDNFWFIKEELNYQLYIEDLNKEPFLLIEFNVSDVKSKTLLDGDMLGWSLAVKKGQQKESVKFISYIISQLLFVEKLNAEKILQIAYIAEFQKMNSASVFGGGKLRQFLTTDVNDDIQTARVKYLNEMLRVEYKHIDKAVLLKNQGYALKDVGPLLEYSINMIQDMLGDSYIKQQEPIFVENLKWPFTQNPTGHQKLFLSEI